MNVKDRIKQLRSIENAPNGSEELRREANRFWRERDTLKEQNEKLVRALGEVSPVLNRLDKSYYSVWRKSLVGGSPHGFVSGNVSTRDIAIIIEAYRELLASIQKEKAG